MKLPAFRTSSLALAASLLATSALLAGCEGALVGTAPGVASVSPLGAIHGTVHGGRQPVVGAAVYVYQAGTTGYGSASTSLLTNFTTGNYPTTPDTNGNYYVTTDSNGFFGLSGEYTCTAGNQVYLYAVGGNTGGGVGTTNPAAGFLAALGQCPSSGSMASVTPSVNMNEASTIAAAYALAGFAVDALHIGIPTSTTPALATLEQTNLANAFATAGNIYNVGTAGVVSSFAAYTTGTGSNSPLAAITAYSITSGVATFTVSNNFTAGQTLILSGFPVSTFLNGQKVTVLATGLSSTQFEAAVTGSTATITKYANSTTVATFTSANTFFTGENVVLSGFPSTAPNSTVPYNGVTVTVIATGLGTTKFEANYPVATSVSTTTLSTAALATIASTTVTESGYATLSPGGVLPTAKLNSLADSLATCVNSAGPSSTPCTTLFGDATSTGTSSGTIPTDTATAAINIAHYPAANVNSIYGVAPGTGNPYNNALGKAPNDWSVSIYYTGAGLVGGATNYTAPHGVAIDAAGNVWVAGGYNGNTLSELSNLGVPISGATTAYTGNGLNGPVSVAIDATSSNVLVANITGADLSEFTTAGAPVGIFAPTTNGTTAALNETGDAQFDGSGNIWTTNFGSGAVVKLTNTGTFISTASNSTYLASNYGIAVEPGATGSVWAVGSSKADAALFLNANTYSAEKATPYYAYGVAIDASGNAWVANYRTDLSKIGPTGATVSNFALAASDYYVPEYYSDAVDGASNIWLADWSNGTIEEVSNSGVPLSGTFGYVPSNQPAAGYTPSSSVAPPTGYIEPLNVAVDGSGNVWFNYAGLAGLQEIVGAAVPVVTPIAYGVANNLLGQMP